MPEYLQPGVYVEEISRGAQPIEGVPTAVAAMLGAAERGGTRPRRITSVAEYSRYFGGEFHSDAFLPASVHGFFENGGRQVFVCRIVGAAATTAQIEVAGLRIRAQGAGAWAQRLWVKVSESSARDAQGAPLGFRLRVALFPPATAPFDCFAAPAVAPQLIEDHDNLSLDPSSTDYFAKRESVLVELAAASAAGAESPRFNGKLTGGTDGGTPAAADFTAALTALEDPAYGDVALLYAPAAEPDTCRALVRHCETNRFRFAVLDIDRLSILATLEPRGEHPDTSHAACYWPWLLVAKPGGKQTREVPPGGHVLGLYARVDNERGVHKAPANETLRDVIDLAQDVSARQQDVLQDLGINVIRKFPGRGIRVWGARTLGSDPQWKYVNLRRLFMYLERSIYQGTQWVVFEPNDARLWARVTDSVRTFLHGQWRSGLLLGNSEDQAFFVKCDQSTMTQDDILNGRLVCLVGVAATRPAEFVIFRISQATGPAPS